MNGTLYVERQMNSNCELVAFKKSHFKWNGTISLIFGVPFGDLVVASCFCRQVNRNRYVSKDFITEDSKRDSEIHDTFMEFLSCDLFLTGLAY